MKRFFSFCFILLTLSLSSLGADDSAQQTRQAELDALWAEVSRSVREGDYEAYKRTCHKEGVLVSGISKKTYALSQALVDWEQDFIDAKSGKMKANVEFRFSQRFGAKATAHETGIFLYTAKDNEGKNIRDYIVFEALLLKKKDGWKIVMEYQKGKTTKAEWDKFQ